MARRFSAPQLVLASHNPGKLAELLALIKGADFRIIADAGHLPCIEQSEAVAALVTAFLRGANYI